MQHSFCLSQENKTSLIHRSSHTATGFVSLSLSLSLNFKNSFSLSFCLSFFHFHSPTATHTSSSESKHCIQMMSAKGGNKERKKFMRLELQFFSPAFTLALPHSLTVSQSPPPPAAFLPCFSLSLPLFPLLFSPLLSPSLLVSSLLAIRLRLPGEAV